MRFMKACEANPAVSEDCPPPEVLRKFARADALAKGKMDGIKKRIAKNKARNRT